MVSIFIDEERCNCCALCVGVCPNEVLIRSLDGCAPLVTDRECCGCENCVVICETGALRVIEEDGDTANNGEA